MYNPALMHMKPSFDLVIFDCDGVLVETEHLVCQIYVQMFAEYGHPLDHEETLQKFYGVTLLNRLKVSAQELGWTPPEEFIPIFNQRLLDLSERELLVIPHVHELIESLSVPMCVASNGTRDEIVFRLKVARLTERFGDAIFSGMEVPHPKPAPDVYLAAAQAFQTPPERCVVIEDSILGVTAGVRAGMKVYGHATFNSAESLRAAGAIPFANMLELKAILTSMEQVPAMNERLQ
jgi:HAD superfamily hydrolase (TIGR01509 family)